MYQSKKREQSCEQRPATGDWRVWRQAGAGGTPHRTPPAPADDTVLFVYRLPRDGRAYIFSNIIVRGIHINVVYYIN